MNIKWSYYLIAGIYILLIILRVINYLNEAAYKKENSHCHRVFSIKKDFFTTVMGICILVTIAINGAALIGGKAINTDSILITLLVIGFTIINSFTFIFYSKESSTICLLGYVLKPDDVQSVKVKEGSKRTLLSITFNKEIESYNYTKLIIWGKRRKALSNLFEQLQKEKE